MGHGPTTQPNCLGELHLDLADTHYVSPGSGFCDLTYCCKKRNALLSDWDEGFAVVTFISSSIDSTITKLVDFVTTSHCLPYITLNYGAYIHNK